MIYNLFFTFSCCTGVFWKSSYDPKTQEYEVKHNHRWTHLMQNCMFLSLTVIFSAYIDSFNWYTHISNDSLYYPGKEIEKKTLKNEHTKTRWPALVQSLKNPWYTSERLSRIWDCFLTFFNSANTSSMYK